MRKTGWIHVNAKPVRPGRYEARRKYDGSVFDVYWRKLQDTDHFAFYAYRGVLGPFNMWEDVTREMSAWRGLAKTPKVN